MKEKINVNKQIFSQRLKPYRSACLSVIIGIFAILLVSVISAVGENLIAKEMDGLGMDSIMLGINDSETVTLNSDVYDVMKKLSTSGATSPVVIDTGTCQFSHGEEKDVFFWGTSTEAPQIVALDIPYGRMFTKAELASGAKVCLIDESIAKEYYQRGNITGKSITLYINGIAQQFEIVGIVQAKSNLLAGITGSVIPDFVYLPYTTLSMFSAKNGYDQIIFKTQEDEDVELFKERVTTAFAAFVPEDEEVTDTIRLTDMCTQRKSMETIVQAFSYMLSLIAGVALMVSGVAVMNAVSGAVRARRREIGIKKSLGAPILSILGEFIADVLLGTMLSLVIGIAGGVGGLLLLLWCVGLPVLCNWQLVAGGSVAMLIIAFLFAFFPAVKAAKMTPVDALREE